MSRRRTPRVPLVGAIILAAVIVVVLVQQEAGSGSPAPASSSVVPDATVSASVPATVPATAPDAAVPDATAAGSAAASAAQLATISVKGRAPMTGYDRVGDFGTAWTDVDHNGCDTRNDILARDLTSVTKSGVCTVLTGVLVSPYTGTTIAFTRGVATSTAVQIDHLVALGDAWQTGAQQIAQEQRVALANDPLNLLAVDGRSNEQKSDGDAATWLPSNKAIRCEYVERQVAVKAKYGLWVTPAEHDAIGGILARCP
jgi:hypothetical protein